MGRVAFSDDDDGFDRSVLEAGSSPLFSVLEAA